MSLEEREMVGIDGYWVQVLRAFPCYVFFMLFLQQEGQQYIWYWDLFKTQAAFCNPSFPGR
jgi:hypothetical protein